MGLLQHRCVHRHHASGKRTGDGALHAVHAVVEAPIDGVEYVRFNATWVPANYFSGLWDDIGGKPVSFPPEAHTHTLSEITDSGTLAAVDDAPSDGNQYARQDGAWAQVTAQGVTVFSQPTQPTANAVGDWWLIR